MSEVTDFAEAIREHRDGVIDTKLRLNLELICAYEDPYQVVYNLAKYISEIQEVVIAMMFIYTPESIPEDLREYVDLYNSYMNYLKDLGPETLDRIDNDFFGEDLANAKRRG